MSYKNLHKYACLFSSCRVQAELTKWFVWAPHVLCLLSPTSWEQSIFMIAERHPELTSRISQIHLQAGAQKQPLISNNVRHYLFLTEVISVDIVYYRNARRSRPLEFFISSCWELPPVLRFSGSLCSVCSILCSQFSDLYTETKYYIKWNDFQSTRFLVPKYLIIGSLLLLILWS